MYTISKLTDYSAAALRRASAELLSALDQEVGETRTEADAIALYDRWMARKNGILTQINDLWLKAAPKDAKRDVGQRVNEIRKHVEETFPTGRAWWSISGPTRDVVYLGHRSSAETEQFTRESFVDITLPGA